MKRYIIGNWKCYKDQRSAREWFDDFARLYRPHEDVEVVVAPTFLCLEGIAEYLKKLGLENVSLAAQDVSPFPRGAYTGAVAADLVKEMVDYVIVGHSDRRRYFHETSHDVANKFNETVDAGLTPIVCVDQPYAMSQLTALIDIEYDNMLIAYGPVDALNFRIPQEPDKVAEAAKFVAQILPKNPIVYGGSLTPDNAGSYVNIQGVSGLFVGSASLDPKSFNAIYQKMAG